MFLYKKCAEQYNFAVKKSFNVVKNKLTKKVCSQYLWGILFIKKIFKKKKELSFMWTYTADLNFSC